MGWLGVGIHTRIAACTCVGFTTNGVGEVHHKQGLGFSTNELLRALRPAAVYFGGLSAFLGPLSFRARTNTDEEKRE